MNLLYAVAAKVVHLLLGSLNILNTLIFFGLNKIKLVQIIYGKNVELLSNTQVQY